MRSKVVKINRVILGTSFAIVCWAGFLVGVTFAVDTMKKEENKDEE